MPPLFELFSNKQDATSGKSDELGNCIPVSSQCLLAILIERLDEVALQDEVAYLGIAYICLHPIIINRYHMCENTTKDKLGKIHFFKGREEQLDKELDQEEAISQLQSFVRDCFHQKNVYFLFGSGTSVPALPIMEGLYNKVEEAFSTKGTQNAKELFDKVKVKKRADGGSEHKNLEEILGLLYSHERYLSGVSLKSKELEITRKAIKIIQDTIYTELCHPTPHDLKEGVDNDYRRTLDVYKNFYRKVVYRNKDLSRIHVFTTNNDLFNETALDELGVLYTNGFTPGLQRSFNPALFNFTYSRRMDMSVDKYEPIENMVYLYKLHGSVTWRERSAGDGASILFPIQEIPIDSAGADKGCPGDELLIYPAPTKQNLSLGSPYVDLIRLFQEKLLEHNSVLFVCGYSFSDEHINNMIYRALALNASLNLVILNDLGENHTLRKVKDDRIYQIWSEESKDEDKVPEGKDNEKQSVEDGAQTPEEEQGKQEPKPRIHYFSKVVEVLLKELEPDRSDSVAEDLIRRYTENIRRK